VEVQKRRDMEDELLRKRKERIEAGRDPDGEDDEDEEEGDEDDISEMGMDNMEDEELEEMVENQTLQLQKLFSIVEFVRTGMFV